MIKTEDYTLFSGGVKGAEAEFGANAERLGMEEVHFTFEGHKIVRKRGIRFLTQDELKHGDVSLAYVSKLMNRKFSDAPLFRKILQSIWHMINHAGEVFVVGHILEDKTVKGGTGWGAELAKLFNKPLYVYDQDEEQWFKWTGDSWKKATPKIRDKNFAGTGTRFLNDAGKKAISELFDRSFSK